MTREDIRCQTLVFLMEETEKYINYVGFTIRLSDGVIRVKQNLCYTYIYIYIYILISVRAQNIFGIYNVYYL